MKKIRWSICDDSEYVCRSFELSMRKYEELEFVGSSNSADACLELCRKEAPDMLLLDIQMEEENSGICVLKKLKELLPDMKIIMLTSYDDNEYICSAFDNGADNYVLKNAPMQQLHDTIVQLFDGKYLIDNRIFDSLMERERKNSEKRDSLLILVSVISKLSASEYEILRLICSGYTYREISKMRFVEIGTIKKHVSRILKKFSVKRMSILAEELNRLRIFELASPLDSIGEERDK